MYSNEDFFAKADYEGGLIEFLTGYGVDHKDIKDVKLKALVYDFNLLWTINMQPLVDAMMDMEDEIDWDEI